MNRSVEYILDHSDEPMILLYVALIDQSIMIMVSGTPSDTVTSTNNDVQNDEDNLVDEELL